MPVWPVPFQSPTTGTQPGRPKLNGVATSAGPELFSLRRYQVMVAGLTTPTVSTPSPFQSPTTGNQPAPPYWKTPLSAGPELMLLRRYQVAVAGLNSPTV